MFPKESLKRESCTTVKRGLGHRSEEIASLRITAKTLPAKAGSTFRVRVATMESQGDPWEPCKPVYNEWT